ncbi:T9SS type B sorting domain-containing protein [Gaetbulibacter aestuarii]|uniref:T9SS type B sorting domain-containing protein n=1 Tax=Gaetbulibacter aestuarii TaxID=1502358 RepID=A0ABW7MVA5_9FLAO
MPIKLYLYLFLAGLTYHVGWAQNTSIPDPNFEQVLIDLNYDTAPIDGLVPTANIIGITDLDVSGRNISDLTGIEAFSALTILNCSDNTVSNLNLSNNTVLTELYCSNNLLNNLDVSILPDLKILWCNNNLLNNLDVTQNPGLISLICSDNNLSDLNIGSLVNLSVLDFGYNNIATIDLTTNINLSRLVCRRNNLTNLDVSNATKLTTLWCDDNKLTVLDTSKNIKLNDLSCVFNLIKNLDLSKNTALTKVDCSNNLLCTLNLKNGNNTNMTVNFGFNVFLVCVIIDDTLDPHNTWTPSNYTRFVVAVESCRNNIPIDSFGDVVSNKSYTLPNLTNGNYFTGPGGSGSQLNGGDVITESQTLYIYNESACGSNESQFNILIIDDELYIPAFFTPNNDGSHDLWMITDNANQVFNVLIYDRYGKLLKYLFPNDQGWNGTYNGNILPTSDYWYVINLKSGETLKGHFTLKR